MPRATREEKAPELVRQHVPGTVVARLKGPPELDHCGVLWRDVVRSGSVMWCGSVVECDSVLVW